MKKLLIATFSLLALTACDGLTDREESCLGNGGTWENCTYEGRKHQQEMARIEARQPKVIQNYDDYDYDYPEVQSDTPYTDYYGDPRHGSWSNGHYSFTNPHGVYASSTNGFLVGTGVGGLLGYLGTKAAMRSSWDRANPKGYTERKNTISKKELERRREQSRKDKTRYRKAKKQPKLAKKKKQKKTQINKKLKRKFKQKTTKKKQFAKSSVFAKSKVIRKPKKRKSTKRKVTKRRK